MEELSILQAVILGVVQGVTEFLPISSSGHLAFFQNLWGFNPETGHSFDILLHFATLLVVLYFSRREILGILKGDWKSLIFVVVGSIPAAIIGLSFKSQFKSLGGSMLVVGSAWIFTALVLWLAEKHVAKMKTTNITPRESVGQRDAWFIGLAQAVAITPGISRSGMTIAAAYFLGIDKNKAIRLSFLLSIPVILGAVLLSLKDIQNANIAWQTGLVGCAAAAISGALSLQLLVHLVRKSSLVWFSLYCILLGCFTIVRALLT